MKQKKTTTKGILKKSSIEEGKRRSGIKWDEENVTATFHPADKDYGHMKINEPPTPYESGSDFDECDDQNEMALNPEHLTANISDDEGDTELTPEQIQHKKEFEKKRKEHYKEFLSVQKARKLIEKDLEEASKLEDT